MIKTIATLTGSQVVKTSNIGNAEFFKFENGIELRLITKNGELKEVGLIKDYTNKKCNKNVFMFDVKNDTKK